MTKICGKCKQDLPIEKFAKSAKKGYQSYCRDCNKAHKTEWIASNRDKVAVNRLWSMYRLRPEDLNAMLVKQNNTCLLCPITFDEKPYRIDHDHACCPGAKSCGKCVRGLLCNSCNTSLGWFEVRQNKVMAYISR